MRARQILPLAFLIAAACSDVPLGEPPPGADAGEEVASDAGAHAGGDAGTVGCGAAPDQKPVCDAPSCYTCADQKAGRCPGACYAQGCWTCFDGKWQWTAVDCDPFCGAVDAGF